MPTGNYSELIKQTLSRLKYAESELQRPSQDVVSISVCSTSRESMKAMMRIYLLSHGINVQTQKSIREFMNHCIAVDKEFSGIDLKGIGCQELDQVACNGKYCLGHDDVDDCLNTANKIKDMVLKKMNIKSAN